PRSARRGGGRRRLRPEVTWGHPTGGGNGRAGPSVTQPVFGAVVRLLDERSSRGRVPGAGDPDPIGGVPGDPAWPFGVGSKGELRPGAVAVRERRLHRLSPG